MGYLLDTHGRTIIGENHKSGKEVRSVHSLSCKGKAREPFRFMNPGKIPTNLSPFEDSMQLLLEPYKAATEIP